MQVQQNLSDEQLALAASQGERDAFATLYERYFQGIYDFALRMVHNPEMAADLVQTSFTDAWENLQKREVAGNIKAWLYTIARNNAIDQLRGELRRKNRFVITDQRDGKSFSAHADVDLDRLSDPQAAAVDNELVELVWSAAAALSPKDYSLLDLYLRRGLSADELATSLHLRRSTVYTKISRLKNSLQESVAFVLLMRRGRRDCPQLDALLSAHGATELTRELRLAIRRHVQECPRCEESKRRFVAPVEIFAATAMIPVAAGLQASLWERVTAAIDFGGPSASTPTDIAARASRPWSQATAALTRLATRLSRRWSQATMALKAATVAIPLAAVGAGTAIAIILTTAGGGVTIQDPKDVRSTSHEIGQPSAKNVVTVAWSRQPDATAYSVDWTHNPGDVPDTTAELPGGATGATSPPLADGAWYFHLRTQGEGGEWTSTVHLGPFVIGTPEATATPTPSPSPSPTSTPATTGTATMPSATHRPGDATLPVPAQSPTGALLLPPTATPRPSGTPPPTSAPTLTSTPTAAPVIARPTSTATPRRTPTPTATPTPIPQATSTPSPIPTGSAQPTPVITPFPRPTFWPLNSPTPTSTATPGEPGVTPTPEVSATATPTWIEAG